MSSKGRDLDAVEQELAGLPLDDLDLQILEAIREAVDEADPVPPGLADRISFAMTVAQLEADVAQIVSSTPLAMTRSVQYERAMSLTFASDEVTAMVRLEGGQDGRMRLHGWVSPWCEVELRERARSQVTRADDDGRFGFDGVERGLVHLIFRSPDATTVITPAFEV